MKLILYSMDDLAGSNIARKLVDFFGFRPTGEDFDGSPIYGKGDVQLIGSRVNVKDLETIPFEPDVCIVASRHRSESGKPTLTCHPTGNFGVAGLGGRDNTLQYTEARYLRQSLMQLNDVKKRYGLKYEVSMEVTHHGPTDLRFPLLYVEVGSTEEQWRDENACKAAAEAINAVVGDGPEDKPSAIGFGGPHYAPNFNGLNGQYAIGHIMPKHAVEHLTKTMVRQMVEKTLPKPEMAIIDWKGLKGAERNKLQDILEKLGMKWVKTSELK